MRSAIASRAVSISTGTRSPDARSVRHTSRPSMPGRPTSSTTASGPVAARASACSPSAASSVSYPASVSARRSASRRARSSSTIRTFIQPILTAGAAFFGCSYMALTLLLRNATTLVAMRTPQKVTALVLVGAVGIASAAYGIGSAAGGGSATAESNGIERCYGTARLRTRSSTGLRRPGGHAGSRRRRARAGDPGLPRPAEGREARRHVRCARQGARHLGRQGERGLRSDQGRAQEPLRHAARDRPRGRRRQGGGGAARSSPASGPRVPVTSPRRLRASSASTPPRSRTPSSRCVRGPVRGRPATIAARRSPSSRRHST